MTDRRYPIIHTQHIGIFGGTFNPPHMGHITAACAGVEALGLDTLLMIPANIPSHKIMPEGSPTPLQRLDMVRLTCRMIPKAVACDMEIERGDTTYTADTVRELGRRYPDACLWLMLGTDSFLSFAYWRQPEEIAKWCKLAVVSRTKEQADLSSRAKDYALRFGAETVFVDNHPVEVSSTQLRQGENLLYLPPDIGRYIRENCLYVDFPALRSSVAAKMGEKRFAHVLGCEAMAVQLAARWGADVNKARVAALLHDVTKALPPREQLLLVKEYGIIANYTAQRWDDLIHADTAAETALAQYGVGQEVAEAIRYHSTGRGNMTLLEKIIYVADKCEETRNYPDVAPIRKLAFDNLDAAVIAVLESCLRIVTERGNIPDPRSREALASMKGMVQHE